MYIGVPLVGYMGICRVNLMRDMGTGRGSMSRDGGRMNLVGNRMDLVGNRMDNVGSSRTDLGCSRSRDVGRMGLAGNSGSI